MARAEESLKSLSLPLSHSLPLLMRVCLISLRVDAAARSDPADFTATVTRIVGYNVDARRRGRPPRWVCLSANRHFTGISAFSITRFLDEEKDTKASLCVV